MMLDNDFERFFQGTILVPLNRIASGRYEIAYEMIIPQVFKFDMYCRQNPDYKNSAIDCMTLDAYNIIAVLACLGTNRIKDASSYFQKIDQRIGPLYDQLKKQVTYGPVDSELAQIGNSCLNMFVNLGKQLSR